MNTSLQTTSSLILGLTLVSGLCVSGVTPVRADEANLLDAQETWQNNRLLQPTPGQREQERQGTVVIYDGLKDITVRKALDQNFERIQNMMFTRIVRTGNAEEPLQGADGKAITEDDGCDH